MTTQLGIFIKQIADLQSKGNSPFPEGVFPARRTNSIVGYERLDTTIFFTAIITFTLQKIRHLVSVDSQQIIDQIAQKAIQNYPDFENKDGLKTYNFWKTKPSQHFPNGFVFKRFEHFRIPDDVDDTAMVYLTSKPCQEDILWLKQKLPQHANLSKLEIKNTYPEYKTLRAYSTWFGQNMYIEFDVCVLCNLMYLVFERQLPLNQNDIDTLTYIRSAIETDRYLTEPFRVAHQYPRTIPIIYHVARLLGAFQITELKPIREKIIRDTIHLLTQEQHFLDKKVLQISLMRLGVYRSDFESVASCTSADFDGFYFFIAGLLTAYQNPLLYKMARWPLFHIRWECEAHCWALLAEYEALRLLRPK
jgi:hypothetical protein